MEIKIDVWNLERKAWEAEGPWLKTEMNGIKLACGEC